MCLKLGIFNSTTTETLTRLSTEMLFMYRNTLRMITSAMNIALFKFITELVII